MAIESIISTNGVTMTAQAELVVDGVPTTQYDVASNGDVSISAIASEITLTFTDYEQGVRNLESFVTIVESRLGMVAGDHAPCTKRVEIEAAKVKGKYWLGLVELHDVKYFKDTDTVTIQPRVAQTASWANFRLWVRYLREIVNTTALLP